VAPPRQYTSEVGELIRQRMAEQGRSQPWLAAAVARELGETTRSQTAVVKWLRNPENLPPMRLFAIERVLGITPGTWSRRFGYLPVDAGPVLTVRQALEADLELSRFSMGVEIVWNTYRAVVQTFRDNSSLAEAPRPRRKPASRR
jgi:hypothetical protein